MSVGFYNTDPDMSDVPPKIASLQFVIHQLQAAHWIPEAESGPGIGAIARWTRRGTNRLSQLGQALRSCGIGDAKAASGWMKGRFSVGFFPPGDPATELWLGCLEELGITEQSQAISLVNLVAGECLPRSGRMKEKLVMNVATV